MWAEECAHATSFTPGSDGLPARAVIVSLEGGITPVERGKGVDMIRTPQGPEVLVTGCTALSGLGGGGVCGGGTALLCMPHTSFCLGV